MKKYRVIFGSNASLGLSQYIIEYYGVIITGRGSYGIPKLGVGWQRLGHSYFYDNKEDAIRECDNLNNGEYVVHPNDDSNN